jgi:hypothetical protein
MHVLKEYFADVRAFDPKTALPFLLTLLAVSYPLFLGTNFAGSIVCAIVALGGAITFCKQGTADEAYPSNWPNVYLVILTVLGLGGLTWLTFYRPMLEHFWIGYDEPVLLSINDFWFSTYDKCCARPLAGIEAYFGNLIMPGTIKSLPLMQALDRWILSVGLFLLMISVLPNQALFAVAVGILMVVNPTEVLRLSPGLTLPYSGAMMFLIFASYIFVLSYSLASRPLLLLACALLGIALLHYETIFLISTITAAILWLLPAKPQRMLWATAWSLTITLAVVRFVILLFGSSLYQRSYAQHLSLSSLFENFPVLFNPLFRFITPISLHNFFEPFPLAAGFGVFVFLIFVARHFSQQTKDHASARTRISIVSLVSLGGIALALLPEITVPTFLKTIPNFDGDLTSRMEFTPGPFQSILWASAVGWISLFLFRSQYWFAAGISILVSCSVVNTSALQAKNGSLNTYLDFQSESEIFRAAAPIIQRSPADSIIFFVIPDDRPSPFGYGYHPYHMSCLLFGREAYAGHYSPSYGIRQRATAFPSAIDQLDNYAPLKGIKNLVMLDVDDNNNVTELKLTSADVQASEPATKSNKTFGPCVIPTAKALPNGDLPFLLPSLKRP